VFNDLATTSVGNDAVRSLSPGMQVNRGQISGGNTGMDLQAATTVTGLQIGLTATGIRGRVTDPITLDDVKIDAVAVGIERPDEGGRRRAKQRERGLHRRHHGGHVSKRQCGRDEPGDLAVLAPRVRPHELDGIDEGVGRVEAVVEAIELSS